MVLGEGADQNTPRGNCSVKNRKILPPDPGAGNTQIQSCHGKVLKELQSNVLPLEACIGFLKTGLLMFHSILANAGEAVDVGSIPGSGNPVQEGMAAHSSLLAWEIPRTEGPGRPQSLGSQRVRPD